MAEPRNPMLALSNLSPHDFIFSLFLELNVFIDSGFNVAFELCVPETVSSVTKKKQINMPTKCELKHKKKIKQSGDKR